MGSKQLITAFILTGLVIFVGCESSSLRVKEVESRLSFEDFEKEYVKAAFLPEAPIEQKSKEEQDTAIKKFIVLGRFDRVLPPFMCILFHEKYVSLFSGESVRWARITHKSSGEGYSALIDESPISPGRIGCQFILQYLKEENGALLFNLHFSANKWDPDYNLVRWTQNGSPMWDSGGKSGMTLELKDGAVLNSSDIPAAVMLINEQRKIDLIVGKEVDFVFSSETENHRLTLVAHPYSKDKEDELREMFQVDLK